MEEEKQIVSNLVKNVKEYHPRKFSNNESSNNEKVESKFDQYENVFNDPRINNIVRHMGRDGFNYKNKFDLVEDSNYYHSGNSYTKTGYKRNSKQFHNNKGSKYLNPPVNKNYDLNMESNPRENIKHFYENKQISSVYFAMILLKKLEIPNELNENFISEVMTKDIKANLEHFKQKKPFRERAYTAFQGRGFNDEYNDLRQLY